MPLIDKFAAAALVVIWGLNFIVIKIGLHEVPPLLLGALRFVFVAFPAILFVRPPKAPLGVLIAWGLTISFGQFAFLFSAIYVGMPAGLASLVLQVQAFFTLALAMAFFGARLRSHNVVGLALAFAGVALLAYESIGGQSVSILGFVLTLLAALSWAIGNVLTKKLGQVDLVGLVAWSGLVPILPFLAASLFIEGVPAITSSLRQLSLSSIGAIAYLSIGASLIGYSIWARLVSRHPISQVAPLPILVPIVGLASAWLFLGEALSAAQLAASLLVFIGLAINVLGLGSFGRGASSGKAT